MPLRGPNVKRCKATAKRTGERCQSPAVTGFSVCCKHGAGNRKKPKRDGSPAVPGGRPPIHGLRSKRLPNADMREAFERILADEELLNLRHDIATQEVVNNELVGQLGTGDSTGFRRRAYKGFLVLMKTMRAKPDEADACAIAAWNERVSDLINEHRQLLKSGLDEHYAREELGRGLERKARLKDSEQRRLKDMHEMMTIEQVISIQTQIADLIIEVFSGDKRLSTFLARYEDKFLAGGGN